VKSCDVGDTIRIGNTTDAESNVLVAGDDPADNAFTDAAGVPTDPLEVVIRVRKPTATVPTTLVYRWPTPGGTEAQAFKEAPTPPEDGHFYAEVVPTIGEGGVWHWSLSGIGTVTAATSGCFFVRERTP
jgi:hypothetical protein